MGYLSCNAESAIATCDSYSWDLRKKGRARSSKTRKAVKKIREFSYAELVAATNRFSAESFLGKGSHGSVYKAVLDDGKLVAAVKKTKLLSLSPKSFQNHRSNNCTNCSNCTSPAENEIEILSRVHHPRLVNLLGFCADSYDTKLLVVEYMPNGSLYDLLHSPCASPPSWTRRVRFAVQIAKAVEALHSANPPVIHRDIKSSNVLIDENRKARLGDFGLALRGHVEDVRVKCTPPAGTLGYLDPGYLAPGDLSAKSDVFSFGILLLEIISGRNAIDVNYSPPSVVDWAVPLIKHGDFAGICDPRIGTPADPSVIGQLAVVAARCVRSSATNRPAMSEVVECLKVVARKVHAPPIWNNLRRHVRREEDCRPLMKWEAYDRSEEVVKVTKLGTRKSRRKVSSIPGSEHGSEAIGSSGGDRMVRSKSVGYFSETNGGLDSSSIANRSLLGRGKPAVAVRMPVMRLSKSRSAGLLQSPRLVQCKSRGFVLEIGGSNYPRTSTELDMAKLVITLDGESDKKMLEKPLVSL